MPRVWTEEQKAAAAETRRRNKEAKKIDATEALMAGIEASQSLAKAIADYGDQEAIERAREEAAKHSTTVQVTYLPLDGDPHTTTWNGIEFKANVPVELRNYSTEELRKISDAINNVSSSIRNDTDTGWKRGTRHHVVVVPRSRTIMVDGIARPHEYQEVIPMVDLARGNPSFEVDGERAKRLVNRRVLPPAGHGFAEDHADEIVEWR